VNSPEDAEMRPDLTTVTVQREGSRVTARISGPSNQEDWAGSVLHRAGFVPVGLFRERFHRLPSAMTDPDEQRHTVTRAFDALQTEGFAISCNPDLIDVDTPRVGHEMSLGDRLGHLTQAIASAGHTREVVAALSEVTAPGDGVLHRLVEALNETADWWEELGEPTDPHYADRLRHITEQVNGYALEIRVLRGVLADRHTDHPQRVQVHVDRAAPDPPASARVAAAIAASPSTRAAAALPPVPAPRPALPPARSSTAPIR